MSQPPTYNRSFSFTSYQTQNPTVPLPGNSLDVELNAVKATLDALNKNIALIQNDDTTLKNLSVGVNQLAASIAAGFNPPKAWLTGTAYTASPSSTVFQSSKIYTCLVSHTSGTFATDLAAGKWQLILDLTSITIGAASAVAFTPAGGLVSTDVQSALAELGTGKAATAHTHVAANISDSTAAGRAFLVAANVAAQQTLLGLGALAFLNTVPVTAIAAQIAFTGVISPAALSSNTNDWSPTNLATSTRIRFSASSAINLTGISAQSDGTILILSNIGSNTITLTNQDAGSAAANRFLFPYTGGYQLKGGQNVVLMYDGTTARWTLQGWHRPEVTAPSISVFTSGTSQTYTTPTDTNGNRPLYIRVRMAGGGGGGGGQAGGPTAGGNGGDSSFESWTAIHGGGGGTASNTGGVGGSGGATGTGTQIRRIAGAGGGAGATGAMGGASALGGAGVSPNNNSTLAGVSAATNSGSGASAAINAGTFGGAGAGGEYVEFIIPAPGASYTYSVGAGGTAGTGTTAGGAGAAGRIEVEAFWQ